MREAPKGKRARLEQCEARLEQIEIRTAQAKTRIAAAETRTEQAETRTEQAETRTEAAKTRTEQAETRAEKAETRVQQADASAETPTETTIGKPPVPVPPTDPAADEADRQALGRLTVRQRQVLELLAKGVNTKQIAYALKISPKTVEYHRKKLTDDLHIHDIAGLVRFALRVGLVPAHG